MRQILKALEHVHAQNSIRRDVKPSNIFIDRHGNSKLGDFGSAAPTAFLGEIMRSYVGTFQYMSPELFYDQGHNYKTDVWSAGMLMYALRTNNLPAFPLRTVGSNNYMNLLRQMLVVIPGNRTSATDALRHPFFAEADPRERPPSSKRPHIRGG